MKLNHEKLYNDLNSEISNQEITANKMCQKIGVSYGVYVSIREGQDIRTGNLLKLIEWLGRPITEYIN